MAATTSSSSPDGDASLEHALVTVVIPAYNEAEAIAGCLDSILAQDYDPLEVLVVDGRSTDATADVVRAYAARDARVRLIDNPERIVPTGMNYALEAARGQWLVRVDAHATIPEGYVERAVAHLATGRWGGVGGRKDGVGHTPAGRAIAVAMASPFGVGNSTYHHGTDVQTVDHIPFGAYPVALARELGGWDPGLKVNQDFEFDYRIRQSGRELLFDPALVIDWECRQSIPALFRQYRRYGAGKTKVARLHPDSMALRHLVAPALVAALVVALVALPWLPWLSALVVIPYALGLMLASALSARSVAGVHERLWLLPAFAAMHIGWGLGFWQGVLRMLTGRDANTGQRAARP